MADTKDNEICADNLNSRLQKKIRDLMKKKNISNKELAERIGVSPGYVTKLMKYKNNFTVETLVRLAKGTNSKLKIFIEEES